MPLHPNQHAYQAGKSVEMAFHQLVVQDEKVLDQQETALGVFLNTEGMFNTSYDSHFFSISQTWSWLYHHTIDDS
jgi:hypothetical protein